MTVRLSINLNDECAAILREQASKGISATESVRRAIAVLHFMETEIAKGNKIAVVEDGRIREVVLVGADPEVQP